MTWHCNGARQGYDAIDVTEALQSNSTTTSSTAATAVVAVQAYHHTGAGAMQAVLWIKYSNGKESATATDSSWAAFNATALMNPGGDEGAQ
jgi:hypothetical protein